MSFILAPTNMSIPSVSIIESSYDENDTLREAFHKSMRANVESWRASCCLSASSPSLRFVELLWHYMTRCTGICTFITNCPVDEFSEHDFTWDDDDDDDDDSYCYYCAKDVDNGKSCVWANVLCHISSYAATIRETDKTKLYITSCTIALLFINFFNIIAWRYVLTSTRVFVFLPIFAFVKLVPLKLYYLCISLSTCMSNVNYRIWG